MELNPHHALETVATQLLGHAPQQVLPAGHGGNSRLAKVVTADAAYALKIYPSATHDPRDRQGVEEAALRFFAKHAVTTVPHWMAGCPGYALLEWIEGEPVRVPTEDDVRQATDFLGQMRGLSAHADAQALPAASEACISGGEIMRQLQQRLAKLQALADEPDLTAFLTQQWQPACAQALAKAQEIYTQAGLDFHRPLTEELTLIPSDFGFHNAMRKADGRLTFIDFEYFGWDDPVKVTADFMIHPSVSLADEHREAIRTAMLAHHAIDPHFATRLHALLPLFALRWSLILLNEFLPQRWRGRAFASDATAWQQAKERQLAKARAMLTHAVP